LGTLILAYTEGHLLGHKYTNIERGIFGKHDIVIFECLRDPDIYTFLTQTMANTLETLVWTYIENYL
jgi:hypothetical protein